MKLFTSERFWGLVTVSALQVLKILNVVDGATADAIIEVAQGLMLGIIAIRTIDRASDKNSFRD